MLVHEFIAPLRQLVLLLFQRIGIHHFDFWRLNPLQVDQVLRVVFICPLSVGTFQVDHTWRSANTGATEQVLHASQPAILIVEE